MTVKFPSTTRPKWYLSVPLRISFNFIPARRDNRYDTWATVNPVAMAM